MCELLVRVQDRCPEQAATATARGDVVVAADDGWAWSADELASPEWRILRFAGVPAADAAALLAPVFGPAPARGPAKLVRARAAALALDHPDLPASLQDHLNGASRAVPVYVVPANVSVASLTVAKPAPGG